MTSLAAGVAIWCTHFVAMLGYRVSVPIGFDPVLTVISLLIAVSGSPNSPMSIPGGSSTLPTALMIDRVRASR